MMHKIIAATVLSLGLAGPAFAYGTRVVPFDPAAELQRATGSAQFPESAGGFVQDARPTQGGSQAFPHVTGGVAHSGVDMLVGGSTRFPVMNPETMSHPPTAMSQDQYLTHEFDTLTQPPMTASGDIFNEGEG